MRKLGLLLVLGGLGAGAAAFGPPGKETISGHPGMHVLLAAGGAGFLLGLLLFKAGGKKK
ncbi:MAG: hypothetical protein IT452_19860 [Planctomycetia bacterium]|nr:hypothetical protein [Planctomycetia bacterium]